MRSVGPGVEEIRIHSEPEHRVFYVAKFEEAVYVLHAFEKKTPKTSAREIEVARKRLGYRGCCSTGTQTGREVDVSEEITRSAGNVFEDLGFSPAEAENLKIRSALMGSIRSIIEHEGLTQVHAAQMLGVSQPRVSDLVRGKIELFSIDALVNMLGAAGRHVEFSVHPSVDRAA